MKSNPPPADKLPGPVRYKKPTGKVEDRTLEKLHRESAIPNVGGASASNERMGENPKCPNCGRRMALVRQAAQPDEQHTFCCAVCNVVFITPDHEPVSKTADDT